MLQKCERTGDRFFRSSGSGFGACKCLRKWPLCSAGGLLSLSTVTGPKGPGPCLCRGRERVHSCVGDGGRAFLCQGRGNRGPGGNTQKYSGWKAELRFLEGSRNLSKKGPPWGLASIELFTIILALVGLQLLAGVRALRGSPRLMITFHPQRTIWSSLGNMQNSVCVQLSNTLLSNVC